jgi:streptomycin 6-kinase
VLTDEQIPATLRWLEGSRAGRAWLASLPGLVAACEERWGLRLEAPYPPGWVSLVLPGARGGEHVVLKLQFPERESEHEAAALAAWNGEGAVRLRDHDPDRHALLLERCRPGTPLSASPERALDVLIDLLPRLWRPAGAPFRALADEAAHWSADLETAWQDAGRPFERRILDAALSALRDLPSSQGPAVLLHQDLHGDNVLAAEREPWLVIDPKPLAGERELGVAPIVRSGELGHGRREVLYRLDRLTAELGLDRERARLWTIGQTIAWCFGSSVPREHVETVRWLIEDQRP